MIRFFRYSFTINSVNSKGIPKKENSNKTIHIVEKILEFNQQKKKGNVLCVSLTGPWALNSGFPEGYVRNKYNVTLIY